MKLVRIMFFLCALYNIDCVCEHISGVLNVGADMLSRNRIADFLRYNPSVSRDMYPPADIMYDDIYI